VGKRNKITYQQTVNYAAGGFSGDLVCILSVTVLYIDLNSLASESTAHKLQESIFKRNSTEENKKPLLRPRPGFGPTIALFGEEP